MTPLGQANIRQLPSKYPRLEHARLLLQQALTSFELSRIALSFSVAENVVLIDLDQALGLKVDVFSLDTGDRKKKLAHIWTPCVSTISRLLKCCIWIPLACKVLSRRRDCSLLTSMAAVNAAVSEKSPTFSEESKNSKPRLFVKGRTKVSPAAIFPAAKRIQI